jgi:hypothetical protein
MKGAGVILRLKCYLYQFLREYVDFEADSERIFEVIICRRQGCTRELSVSKWQGQ